MKSVVYFPLLLGASILRADLIPDAPLLRLGQELDVHFTAKARAEYSDNIFFTANAVPNLPDKDLSLELAPGLEFSYGKDMPFTANLKVSRNYVDYLDSALRSLDDEQDSLNFTASFNGGGPLVVSVAASYLEIARNTPEIVAATTVAGLTRQSNTGRNLLLSYGFTDKLSGSLGVRDGAVRYYSNYANLSNSESTGFPLDFRYKYSEMLTAGISLDFGKTDVRNPSTKAFLWSYDRNFYGLSLIYQPTEKLQGDFRAGVQHTRYNFGFSDSSPSYSLNLTHSVTEKLDQSLGLAQEVITSPTGSISDTLRLNYGLQYANSQDLRSTFSIAYSDGSVDQVFVGAVASQVDIRTLGINLGLTYTLSQHWTFGANYSYTRAIDPSSYGVNTLGVEASLRW